MTRLIKTLQKLSGAAAIAALVVSAPLAIAPVAAQAEVAAPELTQAVAALRGISTMKADFVQTDRNGQSMRGVITLQRPGKIRFQYAPGIPMLVVSDGSA